MLFVSLDYKGQRWVLSVVLDDEVQSECYLLCQMMKARVSVVYCVR